MSATATARAAVLKPWDELTITDDYMFGRVMRNPELCARVASAILGIDIERVEYVETQRSLDVRHDAKGVRFDAYVRDEAGTVYDIEMQTARDGALARRARYYQGMCALDQLGPGQDYAELGDVFVIFICTFDPFGEGRAVYTFENRCRESTGLAAGDGATTVFVSAKGVREGLGEPLRGLLDYVAGRGASDALTTDLRREVELVRSNADWRHDYMFLEEKMRIMREAGRASGEEAFARLVTALLAQGSTDDLARAASDAAYRHELYAACGIEFGEPGRPADAA